MKTIDFIVKDDWIEKTEKFPVAFAQVREDSRIDAWLTEQIPDNARGIMVASGGCTAAHLASFLKQGLELGAYIFNRLYKDLLEV